MIAVRTIPTSRQTALPTSRSRLRGRQLPMDADGAERCASLCFVSSKKQESCMEKDQGSSEDPALIPFVTASIDEIRHAQELRRRIERHYLQQLPDSADEYWCVGAD